MKNKYFLAIVLPEPIHSIVEKFKQQLNIKYNLKGALRSPAHLTLHMPFELPLKREEDLLNVLKQFKFNSEIIIEIKGIGSFDKRVIYSNVIPNENLNDLYRSLKHTVSSNFNVENEIYNTRGFHPHITLAFRDLKKHQFDAVWNETILFNFDTVFKVKAFTLLKLNNDKWEIYKNYPINTL